MEAGVRPQGIVGTSIGALVGALASSGMPWEEMCEHALAVTRDDIVRLNRRAAWINGIRQPSVFKGEALMDFFEELLPNDGWDALSIPVLINAVDLEDGSTEWFGPGARTDISLLEAVYASSALPVFYPPFQTNGHAYVDGGSAHPLALQRAEDEGATGIIGIDPGAGETGDVDKVLSQGMIAVHQRIFAIMTWRRRRDLLAQWDGPPVMYIRPELEGYATFDFDHVEYFLDEGYRAMKVALEGTI
jgi:NTE family protein